MRLRPLSLRQRSTIAFTLMGFVLSALFAIATSWVADDYESTMVAEILKSQADDYSARLATDPHATLPRTRRLSGYLRRGAEAGNIPPVYERLQPGFHEADRIDGSEAHIGVFDTSAGRLIFVVDVSAIESFERHLNWVISAVLVLGTALSGWLGWIFAGGVLRPVRVLANAVDALLTQPKQTELAASISDDALGRLAGAIDRYQARLVAADAYERDFYADASHELRTPITVVRGVADVLVDDPSADAGMRRRLRRLDRGVRELTDLLDLLFGMARRRTPHSETVSTMELIQAAASSLSGEQDGGAVLVDVDVGASGSLHVPRHEGLLLLRAAIRRVVPPETAGTLQVRVENLVIDLVFFPENGSLVEDVVTDSMRSDIGRMPRLASRLAEDLNWHFENLEAGPAQSGGLRLCLPETSGPIGMKTQAVP